MHSGHIPVLHNDVVRVIAPRPGESVLDCTLGLGGHARAFLEATGPDGRLIGLDADAQNLAVARDRLSSFGSRVDVRHMNFRDVALLAPLQVDILFADLGLSSPHIDDPARGFTFRASGPLDLRFDRSKGCSAAELLLTSSEQQITDILSEYGELPRSRSLARELRSRFRSEVRPAGAWKTDDLVECVQRVFAHRTPHVLPQVFQALRIAVNDEIGALRTLLAALPSLLTSGGRCGIISYHSLEDRVVKNAFRAFVTPEKDERTGQSLSSPAWELLTRKPIGASSQEVAANPRARSAKFRVLRRRSHS